MMAHRPAIDEVSAFNLKVGNDVCVPTGRHDFTTFTEHDKAIKAVKEAARMSEDQASSTVATPQVVTLKVAEQLIDASIPTMIGKPSGSPERLDQLAAEARRKGVTLFTGYHSATCPGMSKILQWFEDSKHINFHGIRSSGRKSPPNGTAVRIGSPRGKAAASWISCSTRFRCRSACWARSE